VREHLLDEAFCFTYGDGLADVDVASLIAHHKAYGRLATVTAVQPPGRFGALQLGDNASVSGFQEKPQGDGSWINGGFFVLEREVIDRIEGDDTIWEQAPLRNLAAEGQLTAFFHNGFWQPMDTLRDRLQLEKLWSEAKAPWKVW
jgi:glucose-1-phosphate cytidylyltransferase